MPSVKFLPRPTDLYTLDMARQEAEACLTKGQVQKGYNIATLCQYLPQREWERFAMALEEYGLSPRDRISELLPQSTWQND